MPSLSCSTQYFSCNTWDLVPWPKIEPWPPALGAWSLGHWTTREAPYICFIYFLWILWFFCADSFLAAQRSTTASSSIHPFPHVPSNVWAFRRLHIQHWGVASLCNFSHSGCGEWEVTVVLICIFLMTNVVEQSFMGSLALCISSVLKGHDARTGSLPQVFQLFPALPEAPCHMLSGIPAPAGQLPCLEGWLQLHGDPMEVRHLDPLMVASLEVNLLSCGACGELELYHDFPSGGLSLCVWPRVREWLREVIAQVNKYVGVGYDWREEKTHKCTTQMLSYLVCAPWLSHFSRVWHCATPWTVACWSPLFMGFSRQEYWSGLPCPPPGILPSTGAHLSNEILCWSLI